MYQLIKKPTRRRAVSAAIVPILWMATMAPAFAQSPPEATPPPAPAPDPAATDAAPPPTPAPSAVPPPAAAPAAAGLPGPADPAGPDLVQPSLIAREVPPDDPTGGAYTTPTLLFIPAGAVPTWNARVIVSLDMQGPSAPDRLALGSASAGNARLGFLPGIGAELGLPIGFTFALGTVWAGGDSAGPNVFAGLSPYFQLRYHILGAKDGRGFQLGASATYKFVGFGANGAGTSQDPGEMEWAVSSQYRHRYFEIGLQAVVGKDFATTDSDGEIHAYVVGRPIPQLALGAASQLRYGLVHDASEPPFDIISGAIASVTFGRWQIAALGGESTNNLAVGPAVNVGALGEMFATARF